MYHEGVIVGGLVLIATVQAIAIIAGRRSRRL